MTPRSLVAAVLAAFFAAGFSASAFALQIDGVLAYRACPTAEPYDGVRPTVLLDSTVSVPGVGRVESVELLLGEREHVSYGLMVGQRVSIQCARVERSTLCGSEVVRASCSVRRIDVRPNNSLKRTNQSLRD
jgi:hypothetical protein